MKRYLGDILCAVCWTVAIAGLAACTSPPAAPATAPAASLEATTDWSALVPNARQPLPGVVSGGQPSPEQLAAAREAGIRTVVNLRQAEEPGSKRAEAEALGLHYVEIPVAGAEGVTEANARALVQALAEAEGPVLLHCGSGNRVGALLALAAYHVDGASAAEALEIGLAAGLTRLEPVVRERLALADASEP